MNIIGTKIAAGLIGTAALGGMMVPAGQMVKENILPQNDNNAAIIEKAQMQDSEKEMSNDERQEFGEMEKMNGMNMEMPPEKPSDDDDGTKFAKPNDSETKNFESAPEKPSDDDDGTKYPIQNNQ